MQDIGNCSHVHWNGPGSVFYNGMIAPLARQLGKPAALVYYQGENNMWDRIGQYHCSSNALATAWRDAFAASTTASIPWFIIQLAPCCGNNFDLLVGNNIREAQRRASLSISDAHLVVLNDLGAAGGLLPPDMMQWSCYNHDHPGNPPAPQTHPGNKTEAGRRLGLQLWKRLYMAEDRMQAAHSSSSSTVPNPNTNSFTGPIVQSLRLEDNNIVVSFEASSAQTLQWAPSHNCSCYTGSHPCCNPITQFAQLSNLSLQHDQSSLEHNSTRSQSWINASASVCDTNHLCIAVPPGFTPKWVRFQYLSQPPCVLTNHAGLPGSLFLLSTTRISSETDRVGN